MSVRTAHDRHIRNITLQSLLRWVRHVGDIIGHWVERQTLLIDDCPYKTCVRRADTRQIASIAAWTPKCGTQGVPSWNRAGIRWGTIADLPRLGNSAAEWRRGVCGKRGEECIDGEGSRTFAKL